MKRLQVSLQVVIGIVVLFACNTKKPAPAINPNPPVMVDVIVAGESAVTGTLEVNGTVVANEFAELHPEVSGRITYLNVPEGSFVQQGTVLLRINDADLQAQLNKIKVQLELAQQTEQRLKKLLDINGVNQADYDAALNQVNSLKADIDYTSAMIDKTVLRAPFEGVLGLRQVSPGAYVTPTTIITTLQQVNKVKIDFTVPEDYSNSIKTGATVNVITPNDKNTTRRARVIATEQSVDINTRNLKVRALLENGVANPGSFVKVILQTGTGSSSVMVPTQAIIPDAMNKKMVTVKNGKAVFVNIETGVRREGLVQVTKGLNAGDTVVVSGVLFARPDAPLNVRSVKQLQEVVVK